MEEKEFRPDYMKILKAIRSIGHLPQDAIRDIVDNGFDAGATEVGVYFNEKAPKPKERKALENIIIVDNGRGMSKFELTKALVPADSGRERDTSNELGYFGVGLVSSGLSFSDKIEVITKGINGYLYTHISYSEKLRTRNPINIIRPCRPEEIARIDPYLKSNPSGTMVILSTINRLQASAETVADLRRKTTFSVSRGYFHLKDKCVVKIDGNTVRYYDALERDNCIEVSKEYKIPIHKDAHGNALVNEFITLTMSMIRGKDSKIVDREFPSLQNPSPRTQGFSIIRNGRELCWAQTLDMWAPSGPTNQFRGEICYTGKHLDEYIFDVPVTKDRVRILDKSVRDEIKKFQQEFCNSRVIPMYHDNRLHVKASESIKANLVAQTKVTKSSSKTAVATTVVQQNPLVIKLLGIDMDNTTPNKAMQILLELRDDAKKYQTLTVKTATG